MAEIADLCPTREGTAFEIDRQDRCGTIYAQINPVAFVEFAPSRETRESEHVVLQEHASPNAVKGRTSRTMPPKPRKRPTNGTIQYIDVEFCARDPPLQSSQLPATGGSVAKSETNVEISGTTKSDIYENLLVRIPVKSTSSTASGRSTPSPEPSPPQTPPPFVKTERRGRNGKDDYEQFILGPRTPTKAAAKDMKETGQSQLIDIYTTESFDYLREEAVVAESQSSQKDIPPVAPQPHSAVASHPRPAVTPSPRPAVTPSPRPAVTPRPRPAVTPRPGPARPRPLVDPPLQLDFPQDANCPPAAICLPPPDGPFPAPDSPVPECLPLLDDLPAPDSPPVPKRPPLPDDLPAPESPQAPKRPPLPVDLPVFHSPDHAPVLYRLPVHNQSPVNQYPVVNQHSADLSVMMSGHVPVAPFHKASSDPGVLSPHSHFLRKSLSAPSLIPAKAAMVLGITYQELISLKDNTGSPSVGSIPDNLKTAKPSNLQYRTDILGNHGSFSVPSDGDTFHLSYLGSQTVERTYGILEGIATQLILKSKDQGVETTVILDPSKVEIRPELNEEGLTFDIEQIEGIDACQVTDVHVLGFVVVKDEVAMCHVFSAKDESTALQFCQQVAYLFHSDHHQTEQKLDGSLHCKYIGMAPVLQPHGVLLETINTLLHYNDPAHALPVQMTVNHSFIAYNSLGTSSALPDHYIIHKIEDVKALGLFDLDSRVFGYVVSAATGYNCHCFRCPSSSASTRIVQELHIAVQQAFKAKEQETTSVMKKEERTSTLGKFVNRLKRWGSHTSKTPRSQSYFYTSLSMETSPQPLQDEEFFLGERRRTSTFFFNLEPSSPDSMMSVSVPSSSSSVESEATSMSPTKPQVFTAVYVGSSKAELPPSGQTVMDLLINMEKEGPRGGLAKDGKTIIQMRLSHHSVILVDASEKVFFRRHYSRRTLVGLARHSYEKDIFGLWTCPGAQSEVRCHIFKRSMHTVSSIIQAFQQTFELECS